MTIGRGDYYPEHQDQQTSDGREMTRLTKALEDLEMDLRLARARNDRLKKELEWFISKPNKRSK